MTTEFNVLIEMDADGYFIASVPAIRGCHTQAKSLDLLMKRIREAIELCLEVEKPVTIEFVICPERLHFGARCLIISKTIQAQMNGVRFMDRSVKTRRKWF